MYDWHIYAIAGIAIVLDIASGISQAVCNKTLQSDKMRQGVYHKLSYVFAVGLAALLEYGTIYLELGFEAPIVLPVIIYIVLTEAVSILENLTRINPELINSPIFKLLSTAQNRRDEDKEREC